MFQAWLSCLMDPSSALIQQFGGETFLMILRTTGKGLKTCFLGLHLLSVFSMSSFSSTSCIRLRWDSLSFVQTFCIFVTFMVWSLMTDFRRRHKRRGNCSSISTLTLVNPWTRKTMEATAPYTTGAVLTKEGIITLKYSSEHPDPWHNLWDKVDIFILSHLLGYWCKVYLKLYLSIYHQIMSIHLIPDLNIPRLVVNDGDLGDVWVSRILSRTPASQLLRVLVRMTLT